MSAHTPGPWRWEFNLKHRGVQLCGGRPLYDLTVMEFRRWGMNSAIPHVLQPKGPEDKLTLLTSSADFAVIQPGREHHASWFQLVNHPDMNLIEAAPDLLASLRKTLAAAVELHGQGIHCPDCPADAEETGADCPMLVAAEMAIAKATRR